MIEREITLSSFSVKNERGNRPGDFTTRFSQTLDFEHSDGIWYIGFNKIISMAFKWTNINSGYSNQKIAYSKDDGKTFTDIDFPCTLTSTLKRRLQLIVMVMMSTLLLLRDQKQRKIGENIVRFGAWDQESEQLERSLVPSDTLCGTVKT